MPRLVLLVLIFACLEAPANTFAQSPPRVNAAAPFSIRRGEEIQVEVAGQFLAEVQSVGIFHANGFEARILPAEHGSNEKLKLALKALSDAEPGERELRLISGGGVSNPLRGFVDQYPTLAEAESNDSADHAQAIRLPIVLAGSIQAAGDADRYRFDARKGQTLIFDVQASRLGSALDATVSVFDSAGREIAANNDYHGADSFIAFNVPDDGSYAIEIRDLQYRGGGGYFYRLVAGEIPYLEALEPMTAQRGGVVNARAMGYNLQDGQDIRLDLTHASAGRIDIRAKSRFGTSNVLPFEITDLAATVENEPNDDPAKADTISVPVEITGVISKDDDQDNFRFKLESKQSMSFEIVAGRLGSRLDALLTLKKASGEVIEMNDDAAMVDARIVRELEAGDYIISVRDLTYHGGPDYAYRLKVQSSFADGRDFAIRLQPDNPLIHRGASTKLWCDVSRLNGYDLPITLGIEGLPRGVDFSPLVFTRHASGTFSITCSNDVPLGSFPIRVVASGVVNGQMVVREAAVEMPGGQDVRQCYLTVLDAAPFSIGPAAAVSADRRKQLREDAQKLRQQLDQRISSPEFAKAQAQWEQSMASATAWTTLRPESAATSNRVPLTLQNDGSLLVTGRGDNLVPSTDIYTVVAKTDLRGITAVRLEALIDPSLPNQGPGRSSIGNFVLNKFLVVAAPAAEPGKGQPVQLARAEATYSQDRYTIADAIDDNPESGWAIFPQTGKPQTAIFHLQQPLNIDGGALLTLTLDQRYGDLHFLGRFRLSVSTDAEPKLDNGLPAQILATLKTAAAQRTPEQQRELSDYYQGQDEQLKSMRARIAGLDKAVGAFDEIDRLQKALNASTAELEAQQQQWEQQVLAGARWTPLQFTSMKSAAGAQLSAEADGSISLSGANPDKDSYTLSAPAPIAGITAIQLEALSDSRLPAGGPGRADNGNFVLSTFSLSTAPASDADKRQPVPLQTPVASFEQKGWSAAGLLDDRGDTGWGILPAVGRPHTVTLRPYTALPGGEGTLLTVVLDHQSPNAHHLLGRFRVSVTNAVNNDALAGIDPMVLAALRSGSRSNAQRDLLAAYYRSIAPSLEPTRQRLAELLAGAQAFPPVVSRNSGGGIDVLVERKQGFDAPVTITLEGYTPGRENQGPANTARDIAFTPLTLSGAEEAGTLRFNVSGASQPNTRLAILRAEAKVGDQTIVQYSPAFDFTIR